MNNLSVGTGRVAPGMTLASNDISDQMTKVCFRMPNCLANIVNGTQSVCHVNQFTSQLCHLC